MTTAQRPAPAAVFSALFTTEPPPEDPYPLFETLREAGEPVRVADQLWVVTGYEACELVLRDSRFANDVEAVGLRKGGPAWREHSSLRMLASMMLMANPPRHGMLRKALHRRFTPSSTARAAGMVREVAHDLVAELAERGRADFVADFADLLPTEVISRFIGIPTSDRAHFRKHIVAFNAVFERSLDEARLRAADRAAEELSAYLRGLVARAGGRAQDTLLAHIAGAAEDGSLPEDEVVALIFQIYNASYQTVSSLLGNGMAALFAHPRQFADLRAGRVSLASAVTEMLRHDPPVQSTGRHATTALELGRQRIAPGDMVIALIAAANRDGSVYPEPGRFRADREGPQPLSFGQGIHYCLGAPLATLQAETAFGTLLRLGSLEPAGRPVRRPSANMRGYASLPVEVRG